MRIIRAGFSAEVEIETYDYKNSAEDILARHLDEADCFDVCNIEIVKDTLAELESFYYWNCECDNHYVHPSTTETCSECGADKEDAPRSAWDEIRDLVRNSNNTDNQEGE